MMLLPPKYNAAYDLRIVHFAERIVRPMECNKYQSSLKEAALSTSSDSNSAHIQ